MTEHTGRPPADRSEIETRLLNYQIRILSEEADFLSNRRSGVSDKMQILKNMLSAGHAGVGRVRGWLPRGHVTGTAPEPEDADRLDLGTPGSNIFLDMTSTHRSNDGGGISRVATELARAAVASGQAIPVVSANGHLHPCEPYSSSKTLRTQPGDVYVIIDSLWDPIDDYVAMIAQLKRQGVRCYTIIHDLIPLRYPGLVPKHYKDLFEKSVDRHAEGVDGFVAVSRSSSEDIARYFQAPKYPPLRFAWFHLGSDFKIASGEVVSAKTIEVFTRTPNFLSVGTVEPKKGFALALDAFEMLWDAGHEVNYTIIGHRPGWLSKSLEARLLKHREQGKRLHWLRHCNDADLGHAYRNAYCLVQPSVAEGFGLPLIEAAQFGCPIIASDLDVFREIGGTALHRFEIGRACSLAESIRAALRARPKPIDIPYNTWSESLAQLLSAVRSLG